jgi:hypothetical protein
VSRVDLALSMSKRPLSRTNITKVDGALKRGMAPILYTMIIGNNGGSIATCRLVDGRYAPRHTQPFEHV